ncbi:MAG: guanylate kinase [Gemmataceae bacterium]|nr:guanylate kinase [Gemmataceae bacterium]
MGPLIVVSGPSGSGKSTLIDRLLAGIRRPVHLAVSATTRPIRPGEQDGKHYHFWTKEAFEKEVQAGGFLEWADVFGNYYGTLRREVTPHRERGTGVVLEIDVQGWAQVRQECPDLVSIFVRASSIEAYEKRLRDRGTETQDSLQRRLAGAKRELARAAEYDFQVINDDLDQALEQMRAIVIPLFER